MAGDDRPCVVMVGPALSSRGGIASVCAEYEKSGIFERLNVVYLPSFVSAGRFAKLRLAIAAVMRFLRMLLARRVRVLHVHMATGASAWRKLAFCAEAHAFAVPYIVHLHSGKFPEFYERRCGYVGRALIRLALHRSAWVFVLSEERMTWMSEHGFDMTRVSVLPNLVELPAGAERHSEQDDLVFLGRLEEAKGVSTLLEAFAIVRKRHPRARLLLGGEGDRARYEELARRAGLGDAVHFLGWVDGDAKRQLLARAAVFVLPSRYEGQPMGLLEAMSFGVPCVATRVGGIPDIINDGRNGLLVRVGDVDDLAEAISRLLGAPHLRRELGQAGLATVDTHFSARAVEAKLRATYALIQSTAA